jgi:hypothetical protein
MLASPPVAHAPQVPPLQHCPAPHCSLAVHWHVPHWRVAPLQHWPALQSRLFAQQGWHAPPMQHLPAPHAPSEQHAAVTHALVFGSQHLPGPPHCASLEQEHEVVEHWRVPWSQHWPALQSRLLLQHGLHAPPMQQLPAPQSPSPQHAAATHAPLAVQHWPEPAQSPRPGAPVHGHAPHLRVSWLQHWPAVQSRLLAQQGPATHAPAEVQHLPAPHCASLPHLHALARHCPLPSQHSPALQSRSFRQHAWHW